MKKYIAYCGLDCENCGARIATINDDDALRQEVAKEWSRLNGVEITPEMINCVGCRIDGVKHFARSVSVRWTGMWRPAAAAAT